MNKTYGKFEYYSYFQRWTCGIPEKCSSCREKLVLAVVAWSHGHPLTFGFSFLEPLYRFLIRPLKNQYFCAQPKYINQSIFFNQSILVRPKKSLTEPYKFGHFSTPVFSHILNLKTLISDFKNLGSRFPKKSRQKPTF